MLGDILRKLMGGKQEGIQQVSPRDASQMPQNMNFDRQPLEAPNFGATNPPLPSGMKFGQPAPQLSVQQNPSAMPINGGYNPQTTVDANLQQGDFTNELRRRIGL